MNELINHLSHEIVAQLRLVVIVTHIKRYSEQKLIGGELGDFIV